MTQLLLAILIAVGGAKQSTTRPHMPYFDWGACPFECCTYREWTASRATPVLKERRAGSPTLFTLKPGEKVRAITGVVVTTTPGIIRIHEAIAVGQEGHQVQLRPDDELFMLHYQGEGFGLFWFQGKTFSDEFWAEELGFIPDTRAFEVIALPHTEWWVKIRNSKGQTGWSQHPQHYEGADACG